KQDEFDVGWCLYDGLFLEGELLELLTLFEEGVRILIVQDNSYFGAQDRDDTEIEQSARTLPQEIAWRTYMANKDYYDSLHLKINKAPEIRASIKYYAACQDNQVAYENRYNGLFTSILKSNFNGGRVKANYYQFFRSILHKLPPHQSPSFKEIGNPCAWFDQQKPFQIA
ncbi:MAG: hypothetical protein KDC44_02355, partial [Phaeodactylibacter sp.]|nr:hypothetical protein [Phaeodactylibacter sp.]